MFSIKGVCLIMEETIKSSMKVKIVILFFAFLAALIMIVASIRGYSIYKEHQELNELEKLTEEYLLKKYGEVNILEIKTESSIKGEQLAYVIFEDESNTSYIYGESTTGIMQIGPMPPKDEKSQYKYLE